MSRKTGSTNLNLSHYTTEKDKKDFIIWIKKNFKESDKLATWYGDHLFGKALQPIGGENGQPIKLDITDILQKVYGK